MLHDNLTRIFHILALQVIKFSFPVEHRCVPLPQKLSSRHISSLIPEGTVSSVYSRFYTGLFTGSCWFLISCVSSWGDSFKNIFSHSCSTLLSACTCFWRRAKNHSNCFQNSKNKSVASCFVTLSVQKGLIHYIFFWDFSAVSEQTLHNCRLTALFNIIAWKWEWIWGSAEMGVFMCIWFYVVIKRCIAWHIPTVACATVR